MDRLSSAHVFRVHIGVGGVKWTLGVDSKKIEGNEKEKKKSMHNRVHWIGDIFFFIFFYRQSLHTEITLIKIHNQIVLFVCQQGVMNKRLIKKNKQQMTKHVSTHSSRACDWQKDWSSSLRALTPRGGATLWWLSEPFVFSPLYAWAREREGKTHIFFFFVVIIINFNFLLPYEYSRVLHKDFWLISFYFSWGFWQQMKMKITWFRDMTKFHLFYVFQASLLTISCLWIYSKTK